MKSNQANRGMLGAKTQSKQVRLWLRPAPESLWPLPGSKHALVKRVRGEGTRMAEAVDMRDLLMDFSRLDEQPDLPGIKTSELEPKECTPPEGSGSTPKERGMTTVRTCTTRNGKQLAQQRRTRTGRGLPRGLWELGLEPAAVVDRHFKGSGWATDWIPGLLPGTSPSPESHLPPEYCRNNSSYRDSLPRLH